MTRQEKIAKIRKLLTEKMNAMCSAAQATIVKLRKNNDKYADPVDQAALQSGRDIELNFRTKEWHVILEIKETILRIDNGLYGYCDHCGRQISQKRLMASPLSKLCVECQESFEYSSKTKRKDSGEMMGCFTYAR